MGESEAAILAFGAALTATAILSVVWDLVWPP